MATDVQICNQGMALLGASTFTSLGDGTVTGDACNLVYTDTRDMLLQLHPWKFAIKRVQITKNGSAPSFGRANAFDLPADYLAMMPPYPEDNYEGLDWIVEGVQIVSDNGSPMDFRYIAQITTTTLFLPLFRKALSAAIAVELAEQLTQSTSKLENVVRRFNALITEAKRQDAFEAVNHLPPEDSWVLARDRGTDNSKSFY